MKGIKFYTTEIAQSTLESWTLERNISIFELTIGNVRLMLFTDTWSRLRTFSAMKTHLILQNHQDKRRAPWEMGVSLVIHGHFNLSCAAVEILFYGHLLEGQVQQ